MRILPILAILLLAACSEQANETPSAAALTDSAIGFYDQMFVVDHDGPKGQIHLSGESEPLWFSQTRDGIAYIKSQERTAEVLVFYVNDMGGTTNWADPGAENWIDANNAYFVIGSDAVGGMGSPEMVPFAMESDANAYARDHGGHVMRLAGIDPSDALVPVEMDHMPGAEMDEMPDTMPEHMPGGES